MNTPRVHAAPCVGRRGNVTGHRLRIYLFLVVTLLACINAIAPWGHEAAHRVDTLLQLATGLGAVACGLVVAMRKRGPARWWRLLLVGLLAAFLTGQILWWSGYSGLDGIAPALFVTYLAFPVFALAAMFILVRSAGGLLERQNGPLQHSAVTTFLDGLVAATAFLIFISMGGFGTQSAASLPHSENPLAQVAFSLAELLVVVVAVVITLVYHVDRPYRRNYLLLAAGIVTIASADRLVAYYDILGSDSGQRWAAVGLVLGPLFFAYAMLEEQDRGAAADTRRGRSPGIDWPQLVLPYMGFLGIAALFALHISFGQPFSGFVTIMLLLMVLLIALRQVVAIRAQYLLTQRLFATQRRLARQVHTDALTGLPNRLLFGRRLNAAMREGRFVLIFVDLDDFKEVNDRYGHAAGDDLLRAVGERLRRCLSPADTVARVGGDEFAILVDGSGEEPEVVADRLRVALRVPFQVHGSSVRVRASMGLARPNTEGSSQTPDDLLRQADISMYAGKRIGKDTAVIYQPSSDARGDFPMALRESGGDAVPDGFSLVYQPIVRLPDGAPMAVEALARWTAPNGIDISPESFVAAAEAAGLGADLDSLVLDLACSEVRAAGLHLDVHVNIGAARLGNPSFERHVRRTLATHQLDPSRLVVEITETVPIVDLEEASAQIARLNALGVKVALDDFGVGFNTLMYLHSLPVQFVKLDRRFASGTDPERDQALYRSVTRLCGEMGIEVIVEGVEYAPQAESVYSAGCRLAQGHLFGRAVPIAELSAGFEPYGAPV